MYSDRVVKAGKKWFLWLLLIALVAGVLLLFFAQHPEQLLEDSGTEAIRAAVQRSALQCYAVEGVYPSSLEYLEENYGLQVNHEDYYVSYEAFASNMPPTVRVVLRR